MMNNNKILTVSYGTFSCTLEGFDDSFDTMKAIAEYFRDLAADDRYFGAEPPQPDADMLARIAEREVSRRVEAHEHEGRIMLKAHEEMAEPAQQPAQVAKTTAPVTTPLMDTPPAPQAPVQSVETLVEAADYSSSDAAQERVEAGSDSPDHTDETGEDAAFEAPFAATPVAGVSPGASDDVAAFFAESVTTDVASDDTEETISAVDFTGSISPSAAGKDAALAAVPDEESLEDIEEVEADAPEVPTASFADKLERIRAVVSKQEEDDLSADYEEDSENADAPGHFADLDAAFKDEESAFDAPRDVVAEAAQDIVEAFEQDEDQLEPSTAPDDAIVDEDAEDLDDILKRIEAVSDEAEGKDNLFGEGAGEDDAADAPAHKVARNEVEAALASGDLEEYEDADLSSNATLSDEDEEALNRELAEADAPEIVSRQSLPEIDEEAGEDVSRLMAEADQQMQEPEGKTRRSAFAHLRAAVAARFADHSMVDEAQKVEKEAEVYRSDLAEVVKPRRPMTGEHRTERPADERAAPLKLVAEQRVDTDEASSRGPIAPRRVAATAEDAEPQTQGDGFAAYAAERGAESLPELLEAAAAYLSYVEGHEQFSRPELMSRVRQADCGDFSREDGLRSFGQLLRTGKIEKIKGGRFTASEGIGYKPGHRAAG